MDFNPVELSVLRDALRAYANARGKHGMTDVNTREEVYFIEGIRARIGGFIRFKVDAEKFCVSCGWYGNTTELTCTCSEQLRLTRSGVRVRDAASGR